MLKKVLIKLALGAVLDILLALALRKYEEAEQEENKRKWLVIIDFLRGIILNGLP